MSRRSVATLNLVLALAAGTLLNLLAQQHPFRAALTADKRFTLDTATTHLLHSLPEAVTVTAYFTGDLPPELAAVRQDFNDLLAEYASRSGGSPATVRKWHGEPATGCEAGGHQRRPICWR